VKSGEVGYSGNDLSEYTPTPGLKTMRPRLIYNPKGDIKGFACYFSEWILVNLAHIMPGFCYKETCSSLVRKINDAWEANPCAFDMDAKSNDAN